MAVDVRPLVEDLAYGGTRGFRASIVARDLGDGEENVRLALLQMVEAGDLDLRFELICPDNGRTIRRYSIEEELPIGQEVSSDRCETDEPFVVSKDQVWVVFEPALAFVQRVNRARAGAVKKKDDPKPAQPAPGPQAARFDGLEQYEREGLITQTQAGPNFYGCNIENLNTTDQRSQQVATEGSAVAGPGGAAATNSGQALSGSGGGASEGSTTLVAGDALSRLERVKGSKFSIFAASAALLLTLASVVLLIAGKTDVATAGFIITVLALALAAVPLLSGRS